MDFLDAVKLLKAVTPDLVAFEETMQNQPFALKKQKQANNGCLFCGLCPTVAASRPQEFPNGSHGPYDCPARPNATKDNVLAAGKKLAAHASNQSVFAKHRIKPQDYLEALARVF